MWGTEWRYPFLGPGNPLGGVSPCDTHESGEVLPMAACGERHRGTGSGVWGPEQPPPVTRGPQSPESQSPCSQGTCVWSLRC